MIECFHFSVRFLFLFFFKLIHWRVIFLKYDYIVVKFQPKRESSSTPKYFVFLEFD